MTPPSSNNATGDTSSDSGLDQKWTRQSYVNVKYTPNMQSFRFLQEGLLTI